ncbi:hypothetical protein L9F63_025123 [Diploptera punctata]|uniref:E3 ubiquitin-protein ligase CHFR n=1 Tax=Diploptera punctata TaxID=6984 RepID=A0AAD7ZCI6_DIPPU|nr:hypothetical protein L9F63_025123 [Diploptera punctata]
MTALEPAELIHCSKKDADFSRISINKSEFVIGRSKNSSFIILSVLVSKTQCVFQKKNENWTLCDKSSYGTYINGVNIEKEVPVPVTDGDLIEFGPTGKFKYVFHTKGSCFSPPTKKKRLNENEDSDQTQEDETQKNKEEKIDKKLKDELSEEKRIAEEKLLQEKRLLEDKVKEMQILLEEKEKNQELLNKKLQEKEKERLRDLELLQESKEAQVKAMMENLKKEVAEREEVVRIQLTKEIQNLQDEKSKLENDIRGELCKRQGESAENLKRLREELEKVKKDLINLEGKQQYLEKELEETAKAKEDASESCLRAKQELLHNFGELMETELQCSICNELFVTATTLNCTHTFCKHCIELWKKKKKECPVCRTKITSENRSIAMDNFIDKMVNNLSAEMKQKRQEIVEERQVQELLGPKCKGDSTKPQPRRTRQQLSSDSSDSSDLDLPTTSSDDDDDTDDDYVEGIGRGILRRLWILLSVWKTRSLGKRMSSERIIFVQI